MNDIERTPTGGYLSGDQGELQSLLRSCQHRMLLCGPGVALNSGKARLVIDVQPGDGAPALAVFEAIAELVVAGETVLVACRMAARLQKVAAVAQRLGWQALPVEDRTPGAGH